MDDKARMDGLLRRLKKEMNGAVVEAMEARGIHYPVSYGVSVPAIRDAAKACVPSHELAALLFDQPVRELKLAAAWVDRPEWVTPQQMDAWGTAFANSEITEQIAAFLFGPAPDAVPQALFWLRQDDPWLNYAALLMAGKALDFLGRVTDAQVLHLIEEADALVRRTKFPVHAVREAASLLARSASRGDAAARTVHGFCEAYRTAGELWMKELAAELSWRIEVS